MRNGFTNVLAAIAYETLDLEMTRTKTSYPDRVLRNAVFRFGNIVLWYEMN